MEDLALGFTLSEDIARLDQFESVQVWTGAGAARLSIEVGTAALEPLLAQRQRNLVGRSGCGLCGTESLPGVLRPLPGLRGLGPLVTPLALKRAPADLVPLQALCDRTGATHAAAWCNADGGIDCVREDVGRHNALDKLIGTLAARAIDPACGFARGHAFTVYSAAGRIVDLQLAGPLMPETVPDSSFISPLPLAQGHA